MPLKWHIRQLVPAQMSDNDISICASYDLNAINNLTTNTGIHTFTLLAYTPEQLCLPSCTYMFQYTATVDYI